MLSWLAGGPGKISHRQLEVALQRIRDLRMLPSGVSCVAHTDVYTVTRSMRARTRTRTATHTRTIATALHLHLPSGAVFRAGEMDNRRPGPAKHGIGH